MTHRHVGWIGALTLLASAAFFGSSLTAQKVRAPSDTNARKSLKRLSAGPWAVVFSSGGGTVAFEKNGIEVLPFVRLDAAGEVFLGEKAFPLNKPVRTESGPGRLQFFYRPIENLSLEVGLDYTLAIDGRGVCLFRKITLAPSMKFDRDLTVRLPIAPFSLPELTWLPLKNGVGASLGKAPRAAYRFAGALRSEGIPLAIPMVSFESRELSLRCTIGADPAFSTLFEKESLEWTYPKSVGLTDPQETRHVTISLHQGTPDDALGQFFTWTHPQPRAALGPGWLRDIAMVGYDYMSDGGQGWFRDIDALAAAIPLQDRKKVLLCLHGWYDFVGRYSFNPGTEKLDSEWTAFSNYPNVKDKFPNSVPVSMSLKKMHERIAYAKSRGFRVALYFADGMSAGDGLDGIYAPGRVLYWGGWQGPDTKGKTYCQNPLAPEVFAFFQKYLKALLHEYGRDIDALVWDETFHVDAGSPGTDSHRGYADRAMMNLVKDLTDEVHVFDRSTGREVAFLASDCIGVFNWVTKPPYALMADGTYQDTHCDPAAWSYGIFPNFRNVLWSCNWEPVSKWDFTEFGVRNYQAAVAISNGWGDDKGFSEMSPDMQRKVLNLFHWRKQFPTKLGWFRELPIYPAAEKK